MEQRYGGIPSELRWLLFKRLSRFVMFELLIVLLTLLAI